MIYKALMVFASLCFFLAHSSAKENSNDIIVRVHDDYTSARSQALKDSDLDYAHAYAIEKTAIRIQQSLTMIVDDLKHGGSVKIDMDSFWPVKSFVNVVLFSAAGETGWNTGSDVVLLHIAEQSMQQDQIELRLFAVSILSRMLEGKYAGAASLESWTRFNIISDKAIHQVEKNLPGVTSDGVRSAGHEAIIKLKDRRLKAGRKVDAEAPPKTLQEIDAKQPSSDQVRIQQYQTIVINRDLGFMNSGESPPARVNGEAAGAAGDRPPVVSEPPPPKP